MDSAKSVEQFEKELADFMADNKVGSDIEFPLVEVSAIEFKRKNRLDTSSNVGAWVAVRPASGTETYLGVYLGDFIVECFPSYNLKNKKISLFPHSNPAMWVPDLNRVVWGYESWWRVIKSPESLRQITDGDIHNVWYVKALKDMTASGEG